MGALEISSQILNSIKGRWQDAAVLAVERDRALVKIWDSDIATVQRWKTVDAYLRLGIEERVVVLELSTSDPRKIAEEAGRIESIARRMERSELYSPLPRWEGGPLLKGAADPRVKSFLEDPVPLAMGAVDEAAKAGAERSSGTLTLEVFRRALSTTSGFEGEEERSSVGFHLRAFSGEGSGHWSIGSSKLSENSLREVGRRAGEIAQLSRKKAEFSPGRYDVIISPMVMGNLMNILAFMSSALAVMMGYSFLSAFKPGDAVASELFSLLDVPRDLSLPGGAFFDDEGVETEDKALIERGKLKTLLHNSATASRNGSRSTGNAGWTMPRAWNLEVSPGDLAEGEMSRELRNGIVVMNNWYTRLQSYVEGQFSTVSRDAALLVRNGEVVGNVGRIRLSSSFPKMLKSMEQLSRERSDVWWWEVEIPTRAPYALIRDVELSRPEV